MLVKGGLWDYTSGSASWGDRRQLNMGMELALALVLALAALWRSAVGSVCRSHLEESRAGLVRLWDL